MDSTQSESLRVEPCGPPSGGFLLIRDADDLTRGAALHLSADELRTLCLVIGPAALCQHAPLGAEQAADVEPSEAQASLLDA